MKTKTKVSLAINILRNTDYVLAVTANEKGDNLGFVYGTKDESGELRKILKIGMENEPKFRELILSVTEEYLSNYIVDRNNFINNICNE